MTTWSQQLIEILTNAFEYETKSMLYWEFAKNAKKRGNTEIEYLNSIDCQYFEGRAKGLINAYKILTGREILCTPSYIKKEIDRLNIAIMEDCKSEMCPF